MSSDARRYFIDSVLRSFRFRECVLTGGGGKICAQFGDWTLAFHGDGKSRAARLDSHNFALTDDLGGADDMVLQDRHDKSYVAVLRKRQIGFQQNTTNTYIPADGAKLRD